MSVLNPSLYSALSRRFGDVEIADPGASLEYRYARDPLTDRLRMKVMQSGENYRVNCPVCGDKRKRLYISHQWFSKDDATGQVWDHLIWCHNEDGQCFADYDDRKEFYSRLFDQIGFRPKCPARAKEVTEMPSQVLATCDWPGRITPLLKLPASHPALEYLQSRFFDPVELAETYNLVFCTRSKYRLAEERIIIPVYSGKRLVGWQARLPEERDWKAPDAPPKYFTMPGFKRGLTLYNFQQAIKHRTVIVVEGPADVWAVGPMAAGILGPGLTAGQKKRLTKCRRGTSLVLMMDPEIMADREKLQKSLHGLDTHFGNVLCVTLPEGKDPGSLDRAWLRRYIEACAAREKFKLSWEKWAA